MFVECIDLEHCTLLVEIELDSGDQLLFLRGEVLCERWGQPDGALRGGGVFPHTHSGPGIPTDLQHTWDNDERDTGLETRFYHHRLLISPFYLGQMTSIRQRSLFAIPEPQLSSFLLQKDATKTSIIPG